MSTLLVDAASLISRNALASGSASTNRNLARFGSFADADVGQSNPSVASGFGLVLQIEYCADAMKIVDAQPDPLAAAVSPSLGSSQGAFETKFLVEQSVAVTIQDWARQHLNADPHAGGEDHDGYHVNSVYLDTPNFDTFRRNPFYRRRKFRLRRYGDEATIWLELKRKLKGQVRKRRVSVTEADLSQRLAQPHDPEWDGAWFHRRLEKRQLRPVCQVTYRRFARIGTSATGPIRLTIDGDLFANGAAEWQVPSAPLSGEPLLNGRRIVEFKYREAMPAAFRSLIQDLQLVPTSFSKYRASVAACVPLAQLSSEST